MHTATANWFGAALRYKQVLYICTCTYTVCKSHQQMEQRAMPWNIQLTVPSLAVTALLTPA